VSEQEQPASGGPTGGEPEGQPEEGGQESAPDYGGTQSEIDSAKQKAADADRERLEQESK
jgi:hypothetical protein